MSWYLHELLQTESLHSKNILLFKMDPNAASSLGPSTITAITFFSFTTNTPSCFSKCSGNFQTIGFFINLFWLATQCNASYIYCEGCCFLLRSSYGYNDYLIRSREHNAFFINHFKCPKIMGSKRSIVLLHSFWKYQATPPTCIQKFRNQVHQSPTNRRISKCLYECI